MKIIITSFALLFIPILKADIIFFENFDDGIWPDEWENEVYTDPTSGDTILATNETNWRIGTNFQDIEGYTPPAALFFWMPRIPIPAADLDTWYELSMTTQEINVQNNDSVLIEFDISLEFYSASQFTNGLTIEVGSDENWSQLVSYEIGPEQGFVEIPFHTESFIVETVSEFIKIRWKAYGNDSFSIDSWIIDNVKVSSFLTEPDILINEFLAGSDTCCGADIFDGNTEDFVEIFNSGPDSININGWGFSDTDGLITTVAPDTSIAPGDFLVLWYTGDNNGFPEINEKLSKDGETIFIADAYGNPMISFDFGPQTDDISYGRNPDGSENWEYFSIPTPGQSNVIENSPPGAFVLTYPENNDTLVIDIDNLSDSTIFSWGESVDPDGDSIQYTFQLYGEEEEGSQFFIIYDQVLDNTEISISNNYLSSIVINFYSETNDGYFLQNLSSVPLWWSVFSSDGIDTYGELSSDELGNHGNGFAITLNLSGIDTTDTDPPAIVVNEFLAGSETCCGADIFSGNTEDFVELYNYGTDSINIYGWGFSDTYGLISTVAPDTNIAPGEFLVLWFTGDNNGFPEINEKLSLEGETVFIADSDGIPIISYDFGPQTDDISYGRSPDGSETWEYFSRPTPGEANIQSLDVKKHNVPESFAVFPAYPNPFNPVTTISYEIPEDGFVHVSIYDMKGRLVKTLVNKTQSKGIKLLEWNALDSQGNSLTSGVYLYRVVFGGFIATRKIILVK